MEYSFRFILLTYTKNEANKQIKMSFSNINTFVSDYSSGHRMYLLLSVFPI